MDIFQYLDPYLVLQQFYQTRKQQEPQFSYSTWANELNMQSPSTLRMMVHGKKRISGRLTENYVNSALATADEKNYFRLLVAYAHATTNTDRSAAWMALSKILSGRIEQKEVQDYLLFISDLLLPKLQTLLSFDDQNWCLQSIRSALDVDTESLVEGLQKLSDTGLIEQSFAEDGTKIWKSTSRLLKVSSRPGDVALKAYHNACLDEAKDAQNLPVDSRKHRSLLLPLSDEEFKNFQEEVEAFVKQALSKYQSDQYKDRRLFKMNLNFYPVSSLSKDIG